MYFKKYLALTATRFALLIYLFALIFSCALVFRILPVVEIISGLITLTKSSVLTGIVSFAQLIFADNNIKYALLFIVVAPVPLAFACSIFFTGPLGAFASGIGRVCGFPVKNGMGFWHAARKRFWQVFLLFFSLFLLLFALVFVWAVATIPLAVISELAGRGVLSNAVFYAAIAVTALVIYLGYMFLRVYIFSFIPVLFSDSNRAFRSSLSFSSRNFFSAARYFLISDVALIFLVSVNSYLDSPTYFLAICSFVSAALILLFLYAMFNLYAADCSFGVSAEADAVADIDDVSDFDFPDEDREDVMEKNEYAELIDKGKKQ